MILNDLDLDLNVYLTYAAEYILTLNLTYMTNALSIITQSQILARRSYSNNLYLNLINL